MSKNIYQSLKVEYVQLLSKNDLQEAYDFWTDKLDYLIDSGNESEIRNASVLCDVIYSHLK